MTGLETIIWLCIFFALASVVTALIEIMSDREYKRTLPPPDRSVKRSIETIDEAHRYRSKIEKQS